MAGVTDWFGGEERQFLVRIGELRKIEATCGVGAAEIALALHPCVALLNANARAEKQVTLFDMVGMGLGSFKVDYIREPIFQGLIAGGTSPNDAGRAVKLHIDDRGFLGLVENAPLALSLVIAGVSMPEAAVQPGEQRPAANPPGPSTSASSTASAPPSAGRPRKSTPPASGNSPRP